MASKDNGKGPATGGGEVAILKRQAFLGIIIRTVVLVIFMAAIELYFSASVFSVPLVAAAIILYLDSAGGLVLTGRLAKPLSNSLKALAVTVFLTLLVAAQEQFPTVRGLGLQVLIVGAIWSVHYLAKAYSDLTGVVTRALLIAGIGLLYYTLFTDKNAALPSQLTLVALTGLVSVAAYALLSILRRSGNARLAFAGNLVASIGSPWVICAAIAGIMTYFIFIRQSLLVLGGFGLTVIEWAALCVAILLIFIKIRTLMPVDGAHMFGEGQKLARSLNNKGELKNAAAKVEEFVREGKKEGLVAIMAAALIGNDVPVEQVQGVIAIIVDHEDEKEPPAMFRWAVGNVQAVNRNKRLKAVKAMMEAAVAAVDTGRAEANRV